MHIKYDKTRFGNFLAIQDKAMKKIAISLTAIILTGTNAMAMCCCTSWINNKVQEVDTVAQQIVPIESTRIDKALKGAKELNKKMDIKMGDSFLHGLYGKLIRTGEGALFNDKKTVFLLQKLKRLKTLSVYSDISNSKIQNEKLNYRLYKNKVK